MQRHRAALAPPNTKRSLLCTDYQAAKVQKLGCEGGNSKLHKPPPTDVATLVGPAAETDFAHSQRHMQPVDGCGRCAFLRARAQLSAGHGSYKHEVHGKTARTTWLTQRPPRLGGAWGIGCIFCAHYAQRRADLQNNIDVGTLGSAASSAETSNTTDIGMLGSTGLPRRQCRGRQGPTANTKWARYEINAATQMAVRGVRQHAETLLHRRAARAYFLPDVADTVTSDRGVADEQLFRRGVPQVADWLRCWRACQTPVSFHAASANGVTENFIQGARDKVATSRKAFAAMIRVMGLAIRARKLRVLKDACNIGLALDDRGPYRLISFRCDAELGRDVGMFPPGPSAGWASGCLAVLRRGGAPSSRRIEDLDDDYSKAMADSVVRAMRRLTISPDTGMHDPDLVDALCRKVRVGVTDGATSAQKALRFLAVGPMPNMLCVARDNAHAVSIATKGALLADNTFKEWWDDVFNERHALVPDIKNSEEWSEMLVICQRRVLGSGRVQGGDLCKALRVMSFAKQRYDSCGTPQQQFCCMLVSIAMLLAYVASDARKDTAQQRRARKRLLQMPRQVLTAGLSASYSEETIRFLRLFDVGDHDPAASWRQHCEFEQRCRSLFLEGHVFCQPETGRTCLQIALDQARTAEPIYYEQGKVLNLYAKPSMEQSQAAADSIHGVTEAMLRRLDVEFSDDKVSILFTPFDLIRWHKALLANENELPLQILRRHTRKMFGAWRLDAAMGVREFESAARKLRRQEMDHLASTPRDNRIVWAGVLKEGFASDLFSAGLSVLPDMVRIYLCAMDSTCGVERSLGKLKKVLDSHEGPMDEDGHTIAYLMDIRLDGPCAESHLAVQPSRDVGTFGVEAGLLPTDMTREFAQLWVSMYGRRFALYAGKKKPGPKPKPGGTLAALARNTAAGMGSLATPSAKKKRAVDEPTLLNLPRRFFIQRDDRRGHANPVWQQDKMKQFNKTTRKKDTLNKLLVHSRAATRSSGSNPCTFGNLNPNIKMRLGVGVRSGRRAVPQIAPDHPSGKFKVADLCSAPLPRKDRYVILRPPVMAQSLWNAVRSCNLVVADSPWDLDVGELTEIRVVKSLIIVATGATVVPMSAWAGNVAPHTSGEAVHFQSACTSAKRSLVMGPAFKMSCPCLHKAFDNILRNVKDNLWKFAVSATAGSDDFRLDALEDVRSLLRDVRRVHRPHQGLNGAYFPQRVAG